jgi:hypothetical protein
MPNTVQAAVEQSDLNPATDTTDNSVSTVADETISSAFQQQLLIPASEPSYMGEFRQVSAAALVNPDFFNDRKRVEKAIAALKMPDPVARVRAQLLVNAEKTLYAEAAKRAEKGEAFVLPTKAQIDSKVEEGLKVWRDKQK